MILNPKSEQNFLPNRYSKVTMIIEPGKKERNLHVTENSDFKLGVAL